LVATSMGVTLLVKEFATYRVFPSGVTASVVAPQRSDMFSRFEREAMNSRGER
jgi:hypothetical protein